MALKPVSTAEDMPAFSKLIAPKSIPPLDREFRPAVLTCQDFVKESKRKGLPLQIALEHADKTISVYSTSVFSEDHPRANDNLPFSERLLKFLLWQRGACKVYIAGPVSVYQYLKTCYSPSGLRSFDTQFMGEQVYQKPFKIEHCVPEDMPEDRQQMRSLGRHLDGCRIGFDLGASDLKVSAVVDGQAIFSQEIEWHPREQADPDYHREYVVEALRLAASKLPRLDAIGGSSAGVYINNRPMVASLFRGVPEDRFDEIRNMFLIIRDEFGVPLEIVNDGEVAALAGSMSLEDNGILGIALGSSEATGYVTPDGNITDWLNELAFAPVDFNPTAPVEEWSGDRGCGASYFSQQCVFRLSPKVGIEIPIDLSPAKKLEFVQEKLEAGHEGAIQIWKSIGVYLGYGIAHYADFYQLKHVLLLGRCTSGRGGHLILDSVNTVLNSEFPQLAASITVQLPDEKSRRVGQSIAAASLPAIR